jgi:hypothetical protein
MTGLENPWRSLRLCVKVFFLSRKDAEIARKENIEAGPHGFRSRPPADHGPEKTNQRSRANTGCVRCKQAARGFQFQYQLSAFSYQLSAFSYRRHQISPLLLP